MKTNKYQYLKVIQGYYSDQWCDVAAYDKNDPLQMKGLRTDLKSYRENEPVAFRVINRRLPANIQFHA